MYRVIIRTCCQSDFRSIGIHLCTAEFGCVTLCPLLLFIRLKHNNSGILPSTHLSPFIINLTLLTIKHYSTSIALSKRTVGQTFDMGHVGLFTYSSSLTLANDTFKWQSQYVYSISN